MIFLSLGKNLKSLPKLLFFVKLITIFSTLLVNMYYTIYRFFA